jgi:hypothetical protein
MARAEAEFRLGPVWVLWLLITLAAAVTLAIIAASRAYHPEARIPPMTSAAEPITSYLTIVDAQHKLALVGRRVVVKDVPVESVASERLFWAGEPGREVAVLLENTPPGPLAPPVHLEAGQTVNITGNVKPTPSRAKARSMWNLAEEQLDRLARHPVYVGARSVTVAGG